MPVLTDIEHPAAQVAQVVVINENWAAADGRAPAPKQNGLAAPRGPVKPIALTDKRITEAVAQTIAETGETGGKSSAPVQQPGAMRGEVLSADRRATFARQVAYAKVPGCFGKDALKFQPPVIGPIAFLGLFEIPFKILAAVRGKCN